MKKIGFIASFVFCSLSSITYAQYYYFDTGGTSYPYQQGCQETLFVRTNTQADPIGARAGRFHLVLDPFLLSYSTSSVVQILRTNLFGASSSVFWDWSSESSPSWKSGSNFTILQIDRKNNSNNYKGTNGLYGVIFFTPRYQPSFYTGVFGMEYNGQVDTPESTIETTLSSPGGVEIINPAAQQFYMTGIFPVLQEPCVPDTQAPSISLMTPLGGTSKQFFSSGISIYLSDPIGFNGTYVPYIWTGGNVRTGNPSGELSNQQGIDLSTLQVSLTGNGQSHNFLGTSFATGNALALMYAQAQDKTRQYLDKNYFISIHSGALFDYGIEKPITLTVSVRDRLGYQASQSVSFNMPQGPALITGSRSPAAGEEFALYDVPVQLGIKDDWAGVHSGSIRVTLQGTSGTVYGPYVFSGMQLHLSGVAGEANQPDWYLMISDHPDFPSSGIISVRVYAEDLEHNVDTIDDYTFATRPACSQLGCCGDKYLVYNQHSFLFSRNSLVVSGGINPYFVSGTGSTGYLYCGVENQGLFFYKGTENLSGSSQLVSFFDGSSLAIMGNNLKVMLSGNTLYLSKIFDYGSLAQGGGWGGGGISLYKDACPDGDYSSSYYDKICGDMFHNAPKSCTVKNSPYSLELTNAFEYAYAMGITTLCPIETADITGNISRKQLAKMVSEYAVKVVGLYPNLQKTGCNLHNDMVGESKEMQFYVQIACQLGLMGLEEDGITVKKSFSPNVFVTRAQFGTILSRLIFGGLYNIRDGKQNIAYYTKHLQALKENGIMKNIDTPDVPELRGYVMLMLQRTYQSGLIDEYRFLAAGKNGVKALLNNL